MFASAGILFFQMPLGFSHFIMVFATITHWKGHLTHWQVHLECLTCSWSSHIRGAWWVASHLHQGYFILLLSH
jgi:hypothetical protein